MLKINRLQYLPLLPSLRSASYPLYLVNPFNTTNQLLNKPRYNLIHTNSHKISQIKLLNLTQHINKQLECQEQSSKKFSITPYIQYLKEQNWDINYNGPQIQLTKKHKIYTIKVLFNARKPILLSDKQMDDLQNKQQGKKTIDNMFESEQKQKQASEQEDDYFNVGVFIKRQNSKKWLRADYIIYAQNQHLAIANFITDYQYEKQERANGKYDTKQAYNGPVLSSLELRLIESISLFLENFGLQQQFFKKVQQMSICYEQKLFMEWLNDFKTLA